MMGLFYRDKMQHKEETYNNINDASNISLQTQLVFVDAIILIFVLLIFRRSNSEGTVHSSEMRRKKINNCPSRNSNILVNKEKVLVETLLYLHFLIVLVMFELGNEKKDNYKDRDGGNKTSSLNSNIRSPSEIVPIISPIMSQSGERDEGYDNLASNYKSKDNEIVSRKEVNDYENVINISKPESSLEDKDLSDNNSLNKNFEKDPVYVAQSAIEDDNSYNTNISKSSDIPSLIRNEYRGIKATVMLPSGILVTGEVAFNFNEIIALKWDHTTIFINEKSIIAFY